MWFAVLKVNAKKHLEAVMKDRDGWKARCLETTEDRDKWKNQCQEVATGILPILDLIDPVLTEKCQGCRSSGWSRDAERHVDGSKSS